MHAEPHPGSLTNSSLASPLRVASHTTSLGFIRYGTAYVTVKFSANMANQPPPPSRTASVGPQNPGMAAPSSAPPPPAQQNLNQIVSHAPTSTHIHRSCSSDGKKRQPPICLKFGRLKSRRRSAPRLHWICNETDPLCDHPQPSRSRGLSFTDPNSSLCICEFAYPEAALSISNHNLQRK